MSQVIFFPPSFSTPGPTFLSPMIPSLAIAMSSLTGRFATLPGNVLKLCCTSGPRYCDHSDHSANRLTAVLLYFSLPVPLLHFFYQLIANEIDTFKDCANKHIVQYMGSFLVTPYLHVRHTAARALYLYCWRTSSLRLSTIINERCGFLMK